MTLSATRQQALSWRLGSFRPSDRHELIKAFATPEGRTDALLAVRDFVQQWEKADWLEDYSVERIGKWLGKNAPQGVLSELIHWTAEHDSAARAALRRGIELGVMAIQAEALSA